MENTTSRRGFIKATAGGAAVLAGLGALRVQNASADEPAYTVPFGDYQREIALTVPPELRVIMYRRLMFKVAEALAAAGVPPTARPEQLTLQNYADVSDALFAFR